MLSERVCAFAKHAMRYNVTPTLRRWKSGKDPSAYIVEPTTMKVQKFEPKEHSMNNVPLYISKYSTKGFTIQGNKIFGSIATIPKSLFSWKVTKSSDITVESLQLFTVASPKIEILVIGTGEKLAMLSQDVYQYLKKHNISLEVMDTPHACSTYNFLIEEDRLTGAVLIPPEHISFD